MNNYIPIRFTSGASYSLSNNESLQKDISTLMLDGVEFELHSYDLYIVFISGKDSLASLLYLLDSGVPKHKIECHHHLVDGIDEADELMDWPCTDAYCEALCLALNIKYYRSWKVGGFKREMYRNNKDTAPTSFETDEGIITVGGNSNKLNTRLQFPAKAADMKSRYCSSYLKISVGNMVIRHQSRFENSRTLVITGERALESSARKKLAQLQMHSTSINRVFDGFDKKGSKIFRLKRSNKRFVDHYRPVLKWNEKQVWEIISKHRILPHPAYLCGFGRMSCLTCIFGSPNQFATIRKYMPRFYNRIDSAEKEFGKTINHIRCKSTKKVIEIPIGDYADKGLPFEIDKYWLNIAMNRGKFEHPIILDKWFLPSGAYGESCGPT